MYFTLELDSVYSTVYQVRVAFILLLTCCSSLLNAQSDTSCPQPDDKKAIELYQKGTDKKKYQKEERLAFLKQAMELEPDYADANFAMAEEIVKTAYAQDQPFDPAVPYFLKVIQLCPHYHSDPYYFIGISYFEAEKYADALPYLQKYIDFKDDDVKKFSKDYDDFIYDAKQKLKIAKFYRDIYANPVPFDPHPVIGLCTTRDEYLATISPDNQLAFFTRRMPVSNINMNSAVIAEDNMKEFFMWSKRGSDGEFSGGAKMPPPFNEGRNEGGPTITIDDKHLYFTICKDEGGPQLNCDIYYSDMDNGSWTEIKNMGPQVNDPTAWDSQPSISSDGLTLYFASDRPGGMGKSDIYKSTKNPETGEWGPATNLGPTINTSGNEKSPFIHSDSHTLYFSSDCNNGTRLGLGGYDIFYSRMDTSGKWKEPVNIGYPINSTGDDLGFFVSTDGKTGYFCSNDPNRTKGQGIGGWDIFSFELYKEARPEKVALIQGAITTPDGESLKGATVEIVDAKTHKSVAVVNDTVNATFAAVVNENQGQEYVATVNKKGFAFNSAVITAKDSFTGKPVKMDYKLKEISEGANYTLNDIYYKTNSAQLEPLSLAVVKEFAKFMKVNPALKVKIAGYTDNVGGDQANLALSSDRAYTVMQALVKEGINGERLSFQGYGASKPVASNDSEEGRRQNRRTEFIIIQK